MEDNIAIFAGGCFWCTEGPFMLLEGVQSVTSGYIGGHMPHPTYKQVCTGATGHAEAIKIVYDTTKVSYEELLEVFFTVHDPTQLNRQGNDIGTQYRSAIFPVNDEQRAKATHYIAALTEARVFDKAVVTTIEDADAFYPAEDYHQDYFNKNPEDAYCLFVAKPKLDKVRKLFADRLKKE
ncbi:peptide-methionine (S)-S-oxide reductase MsrA [Sphingobacterium sp. SGG-5]|nr:peptide-methionine (S)-S-oxide reductase MsrA [Sphingobacterium sp. SGG-5]